MGTKPTKYRSFQELAQAMRDQAQALRDQVIGMPCAQCGQTLQLGDELDIEIRDGRASRGWHRVCHPVTEVPVAIH